jgi:anti-anti-sigma factor
MLDLDRRRSAESEGHSGLLSVETIADAGHTGPAAAVDRPRPQPFAVDVKRANGVAIVQPHGELDVATVQTLRAALDGVVNTERLVLDLRGLSFFDSTGLHLLVALDQRARRDGFELTLVAPAAPVDRAIHVSGLDHALPFVAADDAVDRDPGESTGSPRDGIR